MKNLDGILESRDITLLTKVCIVKAMVFPVVMYGCQSWTFARKVIPNLDSLLKSKDISLPAKVCIVKAMVFPLVMYGCER